jgi:hypothetical protein
MEANRKFCSTRMIVKPSRFKRCMVGADLLNDDRGQSFGRLVEEKELCARAQYAADRQHLLLAARELRPLAF